MVVKEIEVNVPSYKMTKVSESKKIRTVCCDICGKPHETEVETENGWVREVYNEINKCANCKKDICEEHTAREMCLWDINDEEIGNIYLCWECAGKHPDELDKLVQLMMDQISNRILLENKIFRLATDTEFGYLKLKEEGRVK